MAKTPPIVRVTWIDSGGPHGWVTPDQASKMRELVIESAGFLIREGRRSITITDSYGGDVVYSPMTIPRVAIKKLKRLK